MSTAEFETVIGLEVHAQLLTQSKAFAPVSNRFGNEPNTNVTPLCLGHPGTLPVLNENLVNYIVKMGLATNCSIAPKSIFARKNYFYPDMPKGYQISQFDKPICHDGYIDIELEDGTTKRIRIKRIHMEEDAGKSIHDMDPYNTLVDLNRAGTPLIEIVTEPDISSPQEAYAYLVKIKQIVQYLGICDGIMEEGSLRCDANISIRPVGETQLGIRTELKNMNSFRNVERALIYEIDRQQRVVRGGGKIIQQTLLWDANKMETRQMRSKEEAHDYRYFPEPDIPPVMVTEQMLQDLRAELPELPEPRKLRFVSEMGLSLTDAEILTDSRVMADYFEAVCKGVKSAKAAANMVLSEVRRVLNEQGTEIDAFPIEPGRLAELVRLKEDDVISSSAMQTVFNTMLTDQRNAQTIAKELNLIQVSDTSFLEPMVDKVLAANPDKVQAYLGGKTGLMGFFVGQIMQQSQGKANPKLVSEMITKKIHEQGA
ncbi:MAG: Asp-tRNA(Asn)/Glu-tRNA(Gln) amidotransferase subunit GatB [Bacteroidetes bacterium]|nr:Asp-tRNA(Asn)/Glu-tRNA(Gln) amidotransferase subunit GatB [Bacteroidota bacterium]